MAGQFLHLYVFTVRAVTFYIAAGILFPEPVATLYRTALRGNRGAYMACTCITAKYRCNS